MLAVAKRGSIPLAFDGSPVDDTPERSNDTWPRASAPAQAPSIRRSHARRRADRCPAIRTAHAGTLAHLRACLFRQLAFVSAPLCLGKRQIQLQSGESGLYRGGPRLA